MGLAASQAHLDLLTLRKSDLEYQIMQISDRRLQLTRDMETLAKEKARKLNNRILKVVKTTGTGAEAKEDKLDLTKDNLALVNLKVVDSATGKDVNVPSQELEEGLRNGKYKMVYITPPEGASEDVDWRTASGLSDEYDTSDDEAATATYDVETSKIKVKDQEFDMQQKTAETQLKAVTSEIDGLKKNIDKTIEMDFKLFA